MLDLTALASCEEDDESGPPVDRSVWEAKTSPASMALVDQLFDLVQEVAPDPALALN